MITFIGRMGRSPFLNFPNSPRFIYQSLCVRCDGLLLQQTPHFHLNFHRVCRLWYFGWVSLIFPNGKWFHWNWSFRSVFVKVSMRPAIRLSPPVGISSNSDESVSIFTFEWEELLSDAAVTSRSPWNAHQYSYKWSSFIQVGIMDLNWRQCLECFGFP